MTDWRQRPYSLPDRPDTPDQARQSFESYRAALEMMGRGPDGIARLSALLTEVSARLEEQTRSAISDTLSAYTSSQDQLVPRSTRTDARSPDRAGQRPDQTPRPEA